MCAPLDEDEPISYFEALASLSCKEWTEAMNVEIKFMD